MTNAAIDLHPEEPTVHALAKQAMIDADGNIAKAASLLEAIANAEPVIYNELTGSLVLQACYDAVRKVNRDTRAAIWLARSFSMTLDLPMKNCFAWLNRHRVI